MLGCLVHAGAIKSREQIYSNCSLEDWPIVLEAKKLTGVYFSKSRFRLSVEEHSTHFPRLRVRIPTKEKKTFLLFINLVNMTRNLSYFTILKDRSGER
jgi:hypothetical protein